jgi:L-2-hydroxyglutarate oxidase LhgO
MDDIKCDILIIGGGVIGAACALKMSQQGYNCILADAEAHLGAHTSSRNSEVIHAGLYYPNNSLKLTACIEGKELLYAYLKNSKIRYYNCGKVVFAVDDAGCDSLSSLFSQASSNNVNILRMSRSKITDLPGIIDCKEALYSPDTGIFDSTEFLKSLIYHFEDNDGLVASSTSVIDIKVFNNFFKSTCQFGTEQFTVTSKKIINAAGTNALNILKNTFNSKYRNYENFYVKGHYFNLSNKHKFTKLYYPVPNELGLGVHLTIDCNGAAKFGPDTVITEGPYNYSQETTLNAMYNRIRQNFVRIEKNDLSYAYSGIRPKILINNKCFPDYKITDDCNGGFVSLLGIESPGLTSCLALANMISERL